MIVRKARDKRADERREIEKRFWRDERKRHPSKRFDCQKRLYEALRAKPLLTDDELATTVLNQWPSDVPARNWTAADIHVLAKPRVQKLQHEATWADDCKRYEIPPRPQYRDAGEYGQELLRLHGTKKYTEIAFRMCGWLTSKVNKIVRRNQFPRDWFDDMISKAKVLLYKRFSVAIKPPKGGFENGSHLANYIGKAIENEVIDGPWDSSCPEETNHPGFSSRDKYISVQTLQLDPDANARDRGGFCLSDAMAHLDYGSYRDLAYRVAPVAQVVARHYKSKGKVTANQVSAIVDGILAGTPVTQLAKTLRLNRDTINNILEGLGPKIAERLDFALSIQGARFYPATWPSEGARILAAWSQPVWHRQAIDGHISPRQFRFGAPVKRTRQQFRQKSHPSIWTAATKRIVEDEPFPADVTIAETIEWALDDVDRDVARRLNPCDAQDAPSKAA